MRKLFTLLTVVLMALSVKAGEVTVADGTVTNDNLPVYGFYADTGFKTQFIYPAASLANIEGSAMNALLFHSAYESVEFPDGEVTVKLAEVEQTTLSAILDDASFQKVYQGSFDIVNNQLVFEFSEPYAYAGGNLLVQVELSKKSSKCPKTSFYGISSTGSGYFQTNIDVSRNFLPKVTISFAESASTCARPSKLAAAATPDGAVFTWEGENEQYQWCVVEKDAEAAGWALVEAKTYTASGLTAGKEYDFYVRTYCDAESQSKEAKVTFSPFCSAPEKVEISDLTHESATLTWDEVAGIEKYQYVLVAKNSTPVWDEVEAKTGLSISVDTLQAATSYDFYVRSWFNAETVSAATKLSFTTNCVAETLPFREDFSSGSMPNCWEAGSKWSIDSGNDDHTTGGSTGFLRYSTGSASDVISPSIGLSENALLDFFYENRHQYSAIPFDIIVLDASNEAELLKESVTTASPSDTWVQKTIDLSAFTGKIVKIQFHGNGTKGYIRIDDLSVTAKPCVTPTKVKADASSTGAVVTWTAGSDETEWNLRYRAVGDEDWKEVKEIVEPSYTLTGLASDIEYEVQVQASCSAEKQSAWSTSATFTPQCPVPSGLRVSQITDTEALVAWDGTEATYNLQYREKNTEEWTTISAIEGKESLLTDLTGSTRYEVQVQSGCEGAFSSVKTFTTACAPLSNAIPFLEDFEETEEGALPSCWSRRTESEYPMVENNKGAYGVKEDSLAHCLVFRGEGEQVVILPAFDAALNARALSFFYKVSASTVTVEVGYLTHLYGTIEVLAELNNTVYEYQEKATEVALKELPEEAKYLVIRYYSASQLTSSHFDNISIADPSPTAVENTRVEGKASKRIENGVLVLEYNGTIFDTTGRKMN